MISEDNLRILCSKFYKEKPGACPAVEPGTVGICVVGCAGDSSCPGDEKCCSNGCGSGCISPKVAGKKGMPISEKKYINNDLVYRSKTKRCNFLIIDIWILSVSVFCNSLVHQIFVCIGIIQRKQRMCSSILHNFNMTINIIASNLIKETYTKMVKASKMIVIPVNVEWETLPARLSYVQVKFCRLNNVFLETKLCLCVYLTISFITFGHRNMYWHNTCGIC